MKITIMNYTTLFLVITCAGAFTTTSTPTRIIGNSENVKRRSSLSSSTSSSSSNLQPRFLTMPSLVVLSSTKEALTATTTTSSKSLQDDADVVANQNQIQNQITLESLMETSPASSLEQQQQQQQVQTTTSMSIQEQQDDAEENWLEPFAWRGVIVVLCMLWASNFAAAKLVMAEPGVDSSLYALARFGVAALALAPGALGAVKRANLDKETIVGAVQCGSWVAFGYLGQTVGLLTTTASRSCVICSMHCVFVAIVAEFWRISSQQQQDSIDGYDDNDANETKGFDVTRLFPAALAVLGVAIVELQGAGGAPSIGDALSFSQPIGFGMGYLTLEGLMKKNPAAALPVSALKLAVVAFASLCMFELTPLFHSINTGMSLDSFALAIPDFSPILDSKVALGGILYTGLITTAFALWIESIAFAKIPATDASIILTTEPLIAAGFGALALGETFGTSDYIGASLIVGACALAAILDNPEAYEAEIKASGVCELEPTDDSIDCDPERKLPFGFFLF